MISTKKQTKKTLIGSLVVIAVSILLLFFVQALSSVILSITGFTSLGGLDLSNLSVIIALFIGGILISIVTVWYSKPWIILYVIPVSVLFVMLVDALYFNVAFWSLRTNLLFFLENLLINSGITFVGALAYFGIRKARK